jgi:hypothetical protein
MRARRLDGIQHQRRVGLRRPKLASRIRVMQAGSSKLAATPPQSGSCRRYSVIVQRIWGIGKVNPSMFSDVQAIFGEVCAFVDGPPT